VLVADDGGRAVFAHYLLDHVGLGRLPVFCKRQVARDQIGAIGARGRRSFPTAPRRSGRRRRKAEVERRDEADRGRAEFLLLDILGGIGAPLEEGFEDARAASAVESDEMPKMSGCSFAENADSGIFGLMS
jgi:hypothetical protein